MTESHDTLLYCLLTIIRGKKNLYIFLFLGAFRYGGSVMVSRTVVMARMNLRPAHLATVQLACSSVKMATAPTLASSATATKTALMAQMRMLLSAV